MSMRFDELEEAGLQMIDEIEIGVMGQFFELCGSQKVVLHCRFRGGRSAIIDVEPNFDVSPVEVATTLFLDQTPNRWANFWSNEWIYWIPAQCLLHPISLNQLRDALNHAAEEWETQGLGEEEDPEFARPYDSELNNCHHFIRLVISHLETGSRVSRYLMTSVEVRDMWNKCWNWSTSLAAGLLLIVLCTAVIIYAAQALGDSLPYAQTKYKCQILNISRCQNSWPWCQIQTSIVFGRGLIGNFSSGCQMMVLPQLRSNRPSNYAPIWVNTSQVLGECSTEAPYPKKCCSFEPELYYPCRFGANMTFEGIANLQEWSTDVTKAGYIPLIAAFLTVGVLCLFGFLICLMPRRCDLIPCCRWCRVSCLYLHSVTPQRPIFVWQLQFAIFLGVFVMFLSLILFIFLANHAQIMVWTFFFIILCSIFILFTIVLFVFASWPFGLRSLSLKLGCSCVPNKV